MSWRELITDQNGTLSHTKLWSNIGMFSLTVGFLWNVFGDGISAELMGVYGGIVVAGRGVSKYLDRDVGGEI